MNTDDEMYQLKTRPTCISKTQINLLISTSFIEIKFLKCHSTEKLMQSLRHISTLDICHVYTVQLKRNMHR